MVADSARFSELFSLLILKFMLSIFVFPFDILGICILVSISLVIELRWAYIDILSVVYQGMSRVCSRGFSGSIVRVKVILLVLLMFFAVNYFVQSIIYLIHFEANIFFLQVS